jgi:hypothetical protein
MTKRFVPKSAPSISNWLKTKPERTALFSKPNEGARVKN